MIVEDEPNLRRLYELEITAMHHEVVSFMDGREAAQEVLLQNPDLIVLDLCMPQGDGLDFLSWLISNHVGIPVIIYTAYSHYKEDYMARGADAYLIKSSDLTDLKREIERLLSSVPI